MNQPATYPPIKPPKKPALIIFEMRPTRNPGAIPGLSAIAKETPVETTTGRRPRIKLPAVLKASHTPIVPVKLVMFLPPKILPTANNNPPATTTGIKYEIAVKAGSLILTIILFSAIFKPLFNI